MSSFTIFVGTIGRTSVGKTCILNSVQKLEFVDTDRTVGVDVRSFEYEDASIRIYDMSGQPRFENMITTFLPKRTNILMVVFDICDLLSYHRAKIIIEEGIEIQSDIIVLVGNKLDMYYKRVVPVWEAEKLAKDNGIDYYEVSAKTGENINYFFSDIISKWICYSKPPKKSSKWNRFDFFGCCGMSKETD